MSDLVFLSAAKMAKQVREKKISPVELVDAYFKQIEKLNSALNAFVELDYDRARRTARDAEDAVMRNEDLGPLHGVPVSIKSCISVTGMRHEAGTRLRAARRRRGAPPSQIRILPFR